MIVAATTHYIHLRFVVGPDSLVFNVGEAYDIAVEVPLGKSAFPGETGCIDIPLPDVLQHIPLLHLEIVNAWPASQEGGNLLQLCAITIDRCHRSGGPF